VQTGEVGKAPVVGDGLHLPIGVAERANVRIRQIVDTLPGTKVICHGAASRLCSDRNNAISCIILSRQTLIEKGMRRDA
jgi:hypothetical protein